MRTVFRHIVTIFCTISAASLQLEAQSLTFVADTTVAEKGSARAEGDSIVMKTDSVVATKDSVVTARPKSFRELLSEADSLRLSYDFASAMSTYWKALDATTDTLSRMKAMDGLSMAQNGQNMMGYCSRPVVVAHQTVPLRDFFLFYPLKDRSWRPTPNDLDPSSGDDFARAIYIPDSTKTVYYSSPDKDGIRNIYRTRKAGAEWELPELINETLTSSSDEIYPMLSQDGKTLYFASKGLYGMGGYDLYMSRWNKETEDWDTPINMGFPYSSPYDDFLFTNTDDGRYTIFASNRDCPADSVCIYVLEYDAMPVRKGVQSVEELRSVVALEPENDPSRMDNSATIEPEASSMNTSRYMEKMEEVSSLRDTIYRFNRALDELRAGLASVPAEEQKAYIADIQERELSLPKMQKMLNAAVKELQDIEMEFLTSGVAIDPSKLSDRSDKEVVGASSSYTFVKNSMGERISMAIAQPEPEFDYSFKILPEGQYAEDNTLPSGIVYQIQFASGANKMSIRELKGLSPVFIKMKSSLVYSYSVGVFRTYADVLSNLNKVKSLGFKDAFIAAYKDGVSISVNAARAQEGKATRRYHEDADDFSKSARAISGAATLTK
ncbi:MAG: hypothetical protein MJZ09_03390 [Bacteroidales bacterium]|nr:hypothetical protein [Bacteroidales bacterium]